MSDRRDATENRDWPWAEKHSHEEDLLQADLRIDRWTLNAIRGLGETLVEILGAQNALDVNQQAQAETLFRVWQTQRTISRHLAAIEHKQENIVATLDNLTAAVGKLGTDFAKVAADVLAALADLRAQIEALTVGAITQQQIDDLTASVTAADDAVAALDAAVPEQPVVEPPVV